MTPFVVTGIVQVSRDSPAFHKTVQLSYDKVDKYQNYCITLINNFIICFEL